MAITFSCPSCKASITLPDDQAGRRTTCLNCGTFLTVPAGSSQSPEMFTAGEPLPLPPPSLPFPGLPPDSPGYTERVTERVPDYEGRSYEAYEREPDEEQEDYRPLDIGYVANPAAWSLVRVGLGMMYWGMSAVFGAMLIYIILSVFLVFTMRGAGGVQGEAIIGILAIVLVGSILASFAVSCVGQCMCCTAPPESEARGKAIGSAVCLLLTVIGGVGLVFLYLGLTQGVLGGRRMAADATITVIMALLFVAIVMVIGHALFIGFLRSVARYFRNEGLVQSAGSYLSMYFILIGVQVLLGCMQATVRDQAARTFFGCIGFVLLILGIVVLVWYLRLIASTRDTVAEGTQRY